MAEIYSSGTSFDTPTCTGGWIEYPFRDLGDSVTKVYHHNMSVNRASYAPLDDDDVMTAAGDKPVRSPFADDAGAYYVGDTTPSLISGGIVEFDRKFANIPADRTDPLGFYAVTSPGIVHVADGALSAVWYSTSVSQSYVSSPPTITITIAASPDRAQNYEVGDTVQIFNNDFFDFTHSGGGTGSAKIFRGEVLTLVGETFVLDTLYADNGASPLLVDTITSDNSAASYDIGLNLRDIDAESINAAAFISATYVKTSTPEDEVLVDKLKFYDNLKNVTQLLDNISDPTISEFLDDSQDSVNKLLEAQTLTRWKGNIYEKLQIIGKYPLLNV